MARNPKQDANLRPIKKGELSKEKAKKIGSAGGKKSVESRRRKREAKEAIRILLNLAAQDNLDKNLTRLGVEKLDRTNMMALVARMFTKAMEGDVNAYRTLMEYGGFAPDQNLKDEERLARIEAIRESGRANAIVSGDSDGGDGGDVIIYLPELDDEQEDKADPEVDAPKSNEAQEDSDT